MPPPQQSASSSGDIRTTAFGRAYPNVQKALLMSCEASPVLLLTTLLMGAGIIRRPKWQRNWLWRAAMWSFLSRWILVGCAITWSWNEWGQEENGAQELNAGGGGN